MRRTLLAALTLVVSGLALGAPAFAQPMATAASPVSGTLTPGDGTAELRVQVRSVAQVPVDNCSGYLDPSAPDVVVDWAGGDLEISVRGALDATLAVHGPDGVWTCDDDTILLLPVVRWSRAPAGRYAVWVGAFASGQAGTATVVAGAPPPRPVLDASASALAGRVRAAQGFESQGAIEVAVRAGGSDAVQDADLGAPQDVCTGFIDAGQPTVTVAYDGAGDLGLTAASPDADLVLVVQAPSGAVHCNDDFNSVQPALGFSPAERGDYAVWVGTFGLLGDPVDATLVVSEQIPEAGELPDETLDIDEILDGGLGPYSRGTYAVLDLAATPASRIRADGTGGGSATVSIRAEVDNPVQGASCRGMLELAPTVAVELSGEGPFALTARTDDDDLTLTVRTPSGGWLCSDDADGFNPGVQIDAPEAGTYLVWVGTYGQREEATAGTVTAAPGEITVTLGSASGRRDARQPAQSGGEYDGRALAGAPVSTVRFEGAPLRLDVEAGGALVNPVAGQTCGGFVGARPQLDVRADGPVRVSASGSQDLTLTIRAPDGSWTCSDDADGTDPSATVDGGPGVYSVWVGTYYRRTEPVPATVSLESVPGEAGTHGRPLFYSPDTIRG